MKIGMLNLLGNCPERMSSHNAGWTKVIEESIKGMFGSNVEVVLLRTPLCIERYDTIIINNGINWKSGTCNAPGGIQFRTLRKFEELQSYKGKLYAYNEPVDLNALASKRKEIKEYLTNLDFPEVETIYTHKNGNKLIFGDSHTVSIYRPGYAISRLDGATLHGALGEKGALHTQDFSNYKHITFYLGNIDVRFHLLRQPSVRNSIDKLIRDYTNFAAKLIKQGKEITIQGLLPIEAEDRKLPGTGLYKGKPFYGSQEERQEVVDYFNKGIKHNSEYFGFNYEHPWLDTPLRFEQMEARQSVHVRPSSYKYSSELW